MTVKVKGGKQLASTSAAAGRHIANMPSSVHARAGQVAADRTRANAPRRTGRLVSSVRVAPNGGGASVVVGAPYAAFVEYGTRYMRGRHFAQNAADDSLDDVADVYMAEVDKQLSTVRGA